MKKPLNQTWRMTLSYLAVIMTMSLIFSSLIYFITVSQLGRPLPHPKDGSTQQETPADLQAQFDARDAETRSAILVSLGSLNVMVLAAGSACSYYLARRTLGPIESAMEAQAQFVSDASHELRTPLTALLTTNEVALRKKHIDDEKARDVLAKNVAEIEKLRGLSEALLGLAKAEKNEVKTKVWIDETVRETIAQIAPVAERKNVTVQDTVEHIEIDTHRLAVQQIMTILLDNAVKYSPEKSVVTVSSQHSAGHVTLQVSDQGIGIQPEDQSKIFERFYRADAARTRSDTSGHGLGLAIAKSVAERQGYDLKLDSTSEKGSVFSLRIPL